MKGHYTVVIEKADGNWGGYIPDLPVCLATGATPGEVYQRLQELAELYVEELRKDGKPIPEPSTVSAQVSVNVA